MGSRRSAMEVQQQGSQPYYHQDALTVAKYGEPVLGKPELPKLSPPPPEEPHDCAKHGHCSCVDFGNHECCYCGLIVPVSDDGSEIERLRRIVKAVALCDADETLGSVKVYTEDGRARWLLDAAREEVHG
jgi:hypothetical protein